MFKLSKVGMAAAVVVSGLSAMSTSAQAQTEQRVEITGSSIKRIASEGALPITVISRDEIQRSGVASVAALIQALPAMQGFLTSSESVNGGGGGATNASLHGLGSAYTLVLLNGRRVAPYNTGSTVNLESIPLSAIERVEVLTDGASAVYGSDAIAGVVNFILRRNVTDGDISVMADKVEQGGGNSRSVSITKGFGDLDRNGFNVLASLSFDSQQRLKAQQREFSKTGIIRGIDGQNIGMRLFSSNSVPGNVLLLTPAADDVVAFYSPRLSTTGNCGANHVVNGETCRFDFASQVELVPETKRTTGLLAGRAKLGEHQIFAEAVISKFESKPEYAPPAQPGLVPTQAMFNTHILPYLAANGLTTADIGTLTDGNIDNDPTYNLRVFDAGGRRNSYKYDTTHLVLGGEGAVAGWEYRASVTLSQQKYSDTAIGGYLSNNRFNTVISSGAWDPLASVAGTGAAALAPAVLRDQLTNSKSEYNSVNVGVSRPLFKAGGGDAMVAVGGDFGRQRYVDNPSLLLQSVGDSIIGGSGGALPFDTSRAVTGIYSELVVPAMKGVEFTGALRHDAYDAAENTRLFDTSGNRIAGTRTEGKSASATTWKLAGRFQPTRQVMVRGSLGTGFKAPTLANITKPLQAFGVTTGSYSCPFVAPDPLAASCSPPDSQYNVLDGGNASTGSDALKPERSKQFTAGMVFEPAANISVGFDYWRVQIRDQITNIPEAVAFANPGTFRSLFVVAPDPITQRQNLTFLQRPVNIADARYSGIDFNVVGRANVDGMGRVTTSFGGTYMLKSEYTVPGLSGYQSNLGKFGVDNDVAFRLQFRASVRLDAGRWTHLLSASYRSGYGDHVAVCGDPTLTFAQCTAADQWEGPEIRSVNPTTGAFGGRIAYSRVVTDYLTFDWQTSFALSKNLDLILGIKNVAGEDPPFSMQDAGGGNMRGFDGRYADPLGRVWSLKANYRF